MSSNQRSKTDVASVPLRICFVDHAGVLGGAELCLLDIAAHFSARGKVVLFSDGPFRTVLESKGVEVEILPAPKAISSIKRGGARGRELLAIPSVFVFAWKLARLFKEFDVIVANSQKALVVSSIASFFARKPLVWYLHDIITAEHFGALNRMADVFLGNFFTSRIIANSESTRASYQEAGGTNKAIAVIHSGIDPARFEIPESELEALRMELGLSRAPIASVFSRLTPWKGQHVVIRALREVPDVQLLIVGAPLFSGEAEYEAKLKRMVHDFDLADRVKFLGFREDVPKLLKMSDFPIHSSIAPEPFGRVIVEGMMAEKPVIATKGGGANEIITHMKTGVLISPNQPEELASAMQMLLRDPETARAIASKGRAEAIHRFSVESMLCGIEREVCAVSRT